MRATLSRVMISSKLARLVFWWKEIMDICEKVVLQIYFESQADVAVKMPG